MDRLDVEECPPPFFSFATLLRIVKRLIVKRLIVKHFRSRLAFVRSVRSVQSVRGEYGGSLIVEVTAECRKIMVSFLSNCTRALGRMWDVFWREMLRF